MSSVNPSSMATGKRVLIACFGSLGDLHPYLAIAIELKRRGHRPVIATLDRYRQAVESEGVEFAVMRPLESQFGNPQEVVRRIIHPRKGPEYLIRHIVMPFVRESYEDLYRLSQGADLLLSHPITVTLPLVAEKRGLPWASSVLSPMSFFSAHDPSVILAVPWLHHLSRISPALYRAFFGLVKFIGGPWEAPLRQLRAELGLPPERKPAMFEGQFSPRLNLALFSSVLAGPQPDWPANTEVCGFSLFDGRTDPAVSAEVRRFLETGEPPVVFTLGSSVAMDPGHFFAMAREATMRLGCRAVFISGGPSWEDADASGPVKMFPYLPYSGIFPDASVIVHPGGIGTMAQAMAAGRPMLVTPVAFDQPDNARRAEGLGIARTVPFRRITPKILMRSIVELRSHPRYRERAARVGARVRDENGAGRACDLLEKI